MAVLEKPYDLWDGKTVQGYGYFMENGKVIRVHVRAFEENYGRVPNGLTVHHKCEVKLCREPTHLEALTRKEHQRVHRIGKIKHDTICYRGHSLVETLRIYRDGADKKRICIECRREDKQRYRKRGGKK